MGLFKVRPSRGSWAFFVVITVTTITKWRWGIHEQTVIRSDGPAVESARAFATCLFGPNVSWVLRDDDPEARPPSPGAPIPPLTPEARRALWEQSIGAWLRPRVAGGLDPAWPGRCVAPLDELDRRLRSATERSTSLGATIATVREMIRRPTTAGDVEALTGLLQVVDEGALARRLAELFSGARELSLGTRDRWSPTPLRAGLYPVLAEPAVPRWHSVDPVQEQVVLASPTVYFYRWSWDGHTHRVDFDRRNQTDTEVGDAVLWREGPRGGVLRASTERGGAVISMGSTRVVALPEEPGVARRGDRFDWQAATNTAGMAWVTNTHGTVQLRARRWDGSLGWGDAAVVGVPRSQTEVAVTHEPLDDARWRVITLHPRAVDYVLEQHVVTTAEGVPPVVTPGAPAAVLPISSALTLTCGAEAVRYVALLGETRFVVARVEDGHVRVAMSAQAVPGDRAAPWGAAPTLRCDAGRALLVGGPPARDARADVARDAPVAEARAEVVTFPVGDEPRVERVAALPYDRGDCLRELLLVDDGLVAVSANASALRAWRRPLQSTRWEPGGFVAALTVSAQVTRTVRSLRAVSQEFSLAVWVEGDTVTREAVPVPAGQSGGEATTQVRVTRVPYRVLMMSEDSGRTFAGL